MQGIINIFKIPFEKKYFFNIIILLFLVKWAEPEPVVGAVPGQVGLDRLTTQQTFSSFFLPGLEPKPDSIRLGRHKTEPLFF